MMLVKPAEFVRLIERGATLDELINDALALTWETEAEHAAVKLEDGRRIVIRGGRDGISFMQGFDDADRPLILMNVQGIAIRVVRIFGHTHPRPTGRSDADLLALGRVDGKGSVAVWV